VNPEAAAVIAQLALAPLPHEGGFFRQTWIGTDRLANGRAAGGAIYFLMTPPDFSALHRLRIAELWHFYAGDPVEHLQLGPAPGAAVTVTLGPEILGGHVPQLLVPAGAWQGARLAAGGRRGWALVGTTTSPAWTEADFELGERAGLRRDFPAANTLITALTR
jgi:predicted cupin superfamily sugar epimerase